MAGTGRELQLAIRIAGKLDGSLGAAINNAQAQLDRLAKFSNKAMTAATVGVALAGAKVVKDSIKTYSEYETALNSAAAVFDVAKGTAEYEELNKAAREVGLTTVKSAKEGANALEYMGLAGWSAEKSAKALIPVVKLSASTGMDLATTSDLVTDTMAAMGIGIDGVGHYLDILAKGNNSANYTSQMLLESLANVGGVFRSLNVGAEDGAAVLGILANQGTKGSEAGTQLNTVLTRMQKQSGEAAEGMEKLGLSMFDAEGNSRNIIDVFQDMYNATKNMTDEERNQIFTLIGGTRGYRALTKIMSGFTDTAADGTPIIRSLAAAYRDADGALDNFYDIKMDTLAASATRFQRIWEDMLLSIGEGLAPNLRELIDHLSEKMPEISEVIVGAIDSAAPYVIDFIDYVIDNLDKIIDGAIKFAKAFAAIKIGTTALRGFTTFLQLVNNLSRIASSGGVGKLFSMFTKAFTGINLPALGGIISSMSGLATPMIVSTAAVVAFGAAVKGIYDYVQHKRIDYAAGLYEQAEKVHKAADEVVRYNELMDEVQKQRAIINNPESDNYQVEAAKQKLQEIADLLSEEYDLVINADTTQLENALGMAQELSRRELVENSAPALDQLERSAPQYRENAEMLPGLLKDQDNLNSTYSLYGKLITQAERYRSQFQNGEIDLTKFKSAMNEIYNEAKNSGIENITDLGSINEYNATEFMNRLSSGALETMQSLDEVNGKIESIQSTAKEFDDSARQLASDWTNVLASDISTGNTAEVDEDIARLERLGVSMVRAGANTDDLAAKFVTAKMGTTDFNEALGEGGKNAQTMAQEYMKFKASIGDTAENAVAGAALIANGYSNAADAAKASSETMSAFFDDMLSLGNAQGIFDGLDTGGIADKITDMAHALDLIPANKAVTINADGNFEVIQEAENQIASLKSVGNVDVSVNANGDFTVLDETTGQIQELKNMGAVSVQVNSEGNIEVLNEARVAVATIDGKTANVTLSATDNATAQASAVAGAVNNIPTWHNTEISATDNASGVIAGIAGALASIPRKVVTVVQTVAEKVKSVFHSAKGSNYFPGGLTYVNDQKGISDPREVIEYGGARWWYEGRDVLADVPKGARIYPAAQSRAFIDGSHENGLVRVPYDGYIAELHQGERVLTAAEAEGYNGFTFADMLKMLEYMIAERRSDGGGGYSGENDGARIVFAPNITINGDGDEQTVRTAVKLSFKEFKELMREYERDKSRKSF